MTNEAGEVVWSGETTPFGEQVDEDGALAETEDLNYTGKDRDPATGLYYFNARWYDAELGQFTTEDPGRDGGNWYLYVGANPLGFVDPSGLSDEDVDGTDNDGSGSEDGEPSVQIDPPGWDPSQSPGEGWEWRGRPGSEPGDSQGNWHNPDTGESLHPDLDHPPGVPPHWDYWPGRGEDKVRIDPDTGRPIDPAVSTRQQAPTAPELGIWARIGLGAAGVVIIIADIATIPSGEGAIGVGLLGKAIGAY